MESKNINSESAIMASEKKYNDRLLIIYAALSL